MNTASPRDLSRDPLTRDPLRGPVTVCALFAAFAIGIAAYGKPAGQEPFFAKATPEASVDLFFIDGSGGSVVARDAGTGRDLAHLGAGEGGFIRVAMRSLTAARTKAGIGRAEPFQLSRLAGGSHVLRDPATGRVMLLNAFGQSNAAVFAALLAKKEGTS